MHVVIIGNGISGITAARHIRKLSDCRISVISSESDYFYSRTALMYIYMGHMRLKDTQPYEDWFWKKNRIELKAAHVKHIDFTKAELTFRSGQRMSYDKLILALGSRSNKFGWPGQDLDGVSGLYSLQDLEYIESCSKGLNHAVIVGGGLIGIELAEMLHTRKIPVTMLVREENYWDNVLPKEEAMMINREIRAHGIDLRLSSNLEEILPDETGRVRAVKVKETGDIIDCQFVGLTAGVSPNVDFLKDTKLDIGKGIRVNDQLMTNIENVYAIGDCAELRQPVSGRRSIEAIWYTGRMMGETVAYNICGHTRSYDPGIWFNSAKFFNIEYQVYGQVPSEMPEEMQSLFWQDDAHKRALRIVFMKDDFRVIGFNLMGIRFRHEVCEKWIARKTRLEEVIRQLPLACFDPEFYNAYFSAIGKAYESLTGRQITMMKDGGYNKVFKFLKS